LTNGRAHDNAPHPSRPSVYKRGYQRSSMENHKSEISHFSISQQNTIVKKFWLIPGAPQLAGGIMDLSLINLPRQMKLSAASCGESSILNRKHHSVFARLPWSKLREMARWRIQEKCGRSYHGERNKNLDTDIHLWL
jgi:hypothetical protein